MEAMLVLIVGAAIYFLPVIVANSRDHPNAGAIFMLTLLLGWTFLGWAAAMIWSMTATDESGGGDDNLGY